MTIICDTMEEFYDTIAGLVARGIMFKAFTDTRTIDCTGGY